MSSSGKRIGLVTWDYATPKGGMGASLQWIARELRAMGHRLCVCSPSPDRGSPFLSPTRTFGGQILFSLLLPFVLGRWVRRQGIDRLMLPVGPGGVFLIRKPRIPVTSIVYHTYGQQSRLVPGQRWKKIFIPLERRTLHMSTHILCFSADTHRVVRDAYGIPGDRIIELPHAVDTSGWSGDPSAERGRGLCVCVARLEARKGVEVLLEAWPHVIKHCPDARLVIVGDGVLRGRIDAAIRSIGPSVERRSGIRLEELQSLVRRAEIAVCPAYLEGFGLAAAEAMLSGAAVIASDTDGLRCLIDHDASGLLVPPGDPQALAEAIVRLLSDGCLRVKMAHEARRIMEERCDPAVCARAIVDALTALA